MEPGTRIGRRYEIVSVGGRSWLGQRYRARDLEVDIAVALLAVDSDLLPDGDVKRALPHFLRCKSLQNPQLVRMYDAFVDAGTNKLYVVEPWLEAVELRKYLAGMHKRRELLQPEELVDFVLQLINGLDYAHRSGLLVPELSSETVFVDGSGLRIAGVGYAQAVGQERLRQQLTDTAGERPLPPELLFGQPATVRTDVFRLAQLVVEMARRAPLQKGEPPLVQPLDEPHRALTPALERALLPHAESRPESAMALARLLWPARFPAVDLTDFDATAPIMRVEPLAADAPEVETREIDVGELRRIQGKDVTRRVSEEEIFPHRVMAAQETAALFDEKAANIALQSQSPISELTAAKTESTRVGKKPTMPAPPPPPAEVVLIADDPSRPIDISHLPLASSDDLDEVLEAEEPSKVIEISSYRSPSGGDRGGANFDAGTDPGDSAMTAPRVLATPEELREASGPFAIPSPPTKPLPEPQAPAPPPSRSGGGSALYVAGGLALVALVGLGVWAYPLLATPTRPAPVHAATSGTTTGAPPAPPAVPTPSATGGDLRTAAPPAAVDAGPRAAEPIVTKPDVPALTAPPTSPNPPPAGWCPEGMQIVSGVPKVCIDQFEFPGKDQLPKTGVSLTEAGQLCAHRGHRLCRDAEWEAACRGHKGASYPYGGGHDGTKCNEDKNRGIVAAGSFGECVSASDAYDMSGNAAEWVASGNVRGGAAGWGSPRCSQLGHSRVEAGRPLIGFRCCSDLPE